MDYKANVEGIVRKYHENMGDLNTQYTEIKNRLQLEMKSFVTSMDSSLEEMCRALSERNTLKEKLTKEDKIVIDNVESGRFKIALENMIGSQRSAYEKEVLTAYRKAKEKTPEKELVLCGYLGTKEFSDTTKELSLVIPVRASDKESSGSLEEALYGHNLIVGSFDAEAEYRGFVEFKLKVPAEQVEEKARELASNLEKDLINGLVKANIKYGIVFLDKPETKPQEIAKEPSSQQAAETTIDNREYYTSIQAARIWQEKHKAKGKEIDFDKVYFNIIRRTKRKRIRPPFEFKRKGRNYFIEKNSFDRFSDENLIEKKKNREDLFSPEKQEYSIQEAAKILGVSDRYIQILGKRGNLQKIRSGFISGNSLAQYIQSHKQSQTKGEN